MKFYQEIKLLPQPDIDRYFLWQKVYPKIHSALASIKKENERVDVGVSFPEYNLAFNDLCCKLRFFSKSKKLLEQLNIIHWLNDVSDYVSVSEIQDVPEKITTYVCFKRRQVKSNIERIARRKTKSKNKEFSYEQALTILKEKKIKNKTSKLPFIYMQSSSGYKFRLFVEKIIVNQSSDGDFNLYGLSSTSTVPEF